MPNPIQLELPDLITLKDNIQLFQLAKNDRLSYVGVGSANSPFKSRGLNFSEVRQYQAGDDIRQIDWRITAKYGKPFTKLYQEEKERQVYVLCDLRPNMQFASHGDFKSTMAGRLSALTAFLAERQNYTLIYQILTNKVLSSTQNLSTSDLIPKFLHDLTKTLHTTSSVSFSDIIPFMLQFIKSGSSIFLFSDFHDLTNHDIQQLAKLSTKSSINFIHLYDQMEFTLPSEILPYSNGKEIMLLDSNHKSIQHKFNEIWSKKTDELKQSLRKYDINYLPIMTHQNYVKKFIDFCQGE